jgi:SAM-dependent methyltransferase
MAATSNQLADLFFEHRGKTIDKWEHYFAIYSRELVPFVAAKLPVRLLEIGVQNGGSLELWLKYLPEGSEIIGVDIDPKVGSLTFEGAISAFVLDASDSSGLADALGDGRFDVIIDDGSHISSDVITTFRLLFDRLLPGGKYIVEDMHASYWASHEGGYRLGTSAIEFFKNLVDALNSDHFQNVDGVEVHELRQLSRSLASITFYDSVVVIEKVVNEKIARYRRALSGVRSDVVDPIAGIMEQPVVQVGALLFSDELKRHIEKSILARLDEDKADAREMSRVEAARDEHLVRIRHLESSLKEIYASASWRWTRPLRALKAACS